MPYYADVKSGQDVALFVEKCGRPSQQIGTARGGEPIHAVKLGGDRKPAVLIKAGSHATEIAGIHAALTLLEEGLETDREVYVIPCGAPFDYGGYGRALDLAAGEDLGVTSDGECLAALQRAGRLFHEAEHWALYHVGDMVFAWVDQEHFDARQLFYGRMDVLAQSDPRLRREISGKRVFYPNAVYYEGDGQGSYDHGGLVSLVSPLGWVNNMNGFFDRCDAPEEVRAVREFCLRLKPALVIDLHESCINARIPQSLSASGEKLGDHFLILPPVHGPSFETVETPVAEAMLEATRASGHECFTKSQLEAAWGYDDTDFYHGYVRFNKRGACSFYQWVLLFAEVSIVVEPRMDRPCADRVDIHTAAVRAALAEYSRLLEERR